MDDTFNEFKKFIKYFSSRLVQTLVQSRLGDEIKQPCAPAPASEWFNMKIDELGEVSAHLKSNIKSNPPLGGMTVEFVLFTSTGRLLPLEAWTLRLDDKNKDSQVNIRTELYHQMSTLLRSVSVAARMTPMHRLYVKKQDSEHFVVLYRVYEKDMISNMGDNFKTKKIGKLASPHGMLCLDLIYRTAMHFEDSEYEECSKENLENTLTEEQLPEDAKTPKAESAAIDVKEKKIRSSPLSTNSSNFPSSNSSAPKFILGQSTSSEGSQNSDKGDDDDTRPSLAELRNHSFPFVSLLQSAYTPLIRKKTQSNVGIDTSCNSAKTSENESSLGKNSEGSRNEEKHIEEEDEDEDDDANFGINGNEEDDSFVELLHLSEFGTGSASGQNELGELLKQLRIAPEISQMRRYGENIESDLREEINRLGVHKEQFEAFVNHVNTIADND